MLKKYKLDQRILSKITNPSKFHTYLPIVFQRIVKPMEQQLKSLMVVFKLSNEAAIFASDLKHRLFEDSMYRNEIGVRPEDSLIILNQKLFGLIEKYQGILNEMIAESTEKDFKAQAHLSIAVYFASYFHQENESCKIYLSKNSSDEGLKKFVQMWDYNEKKKTEGIKETFRTKMRDFNYFINTSKIIES